MKTYPVNDGTMEIQVRCSNDSQNAYPILGDNYIATSTGDPTSTGLCDLSEEKFQKLFKMDYGTTINKWPTDKQLLDLAYSILWNGTYYTI